VKGKIQEVKEWIRNVGGKDKVSGEQRTKESLRFLPWPCSSRAWRSERR
jgi:hypothetical protein